MIANHLIFGTYAFWLPNDERGSWSTYIRNKKLLAFGNATKTNTQCSVAHQPYNQERRREEEKILQFPPVKLNGFQARAVGHGIAHAVEESQYAVFACAIMPNHVHLIVAEHQNSPRKIIGHCKSRATHHLNLEKLNPMVCNDVSGGVHAALNASPWARGGWVVYLDTDDAVLHAIEYVNNNPIKEGLPPQRWKFVAEYKR